MSTKTLARRGNGGLALRSAFDDSLHPWTDWLNEIAGKRGLTMPAVNINETDKSYHLTVAAPGLKKDDFNVEVQANILTISSEREENKEDKGENYSRHEYNYSSFSRSFTLPEEVKQDAIEAEYKNGELQLTIPKSKDTQKPTTKVAIK